MRVTCNFSCVVLRAESHFVGEMAFSDRADGNVDVPRWWEQTAGERNFHVFYMFLDGLANDGYASQVSTIIFHLGESSRSEYLPRVGTPPWRGPCSPSNHFHFKVKSKYRFEFSKSNWIRLFKSIWFQSQIKVLIRLFQELRLRAKEQYRYLGGERGTFVADSAYEDELGEADQWRVLEDALREMGVQVYKAQNHALQNPEP